MVKSRLYLTILVAMGVFLSACGSDSGSNFTPLQNLSSSSNSQNKETDKKDSVKNSTDSKVSNALVEYDSLYDSYSGDYLRTIRFGMYVWMADNASNKVSTVKSVCYDDDDENCSANGRLYQSVYADDACPRGFHVPTAADWEALREFLVQNGQLEKTFNLFLGGYCADARDSLLCRDLGSAGAYLVAGNGIISFASITQKPSIAIAKRDEYYSLRCVNYSYIVAKKDELPVCDTLSSKYLNSFYVTDEKMSFRCTGNRWVDDFSTACDAEGMSMVANDTMYICKYGEWQVAKITDSRDSCTEANEGKSYTFNGVPYVCKNNAWEEFSSVEKSFGLCVDSLMGKLDSIESVAENKSVYKVYICDSTGWRVANMIDVVGECDSNRTYETMEYRSVGYICRNEKWEALNELEQELGACTPKRQGLIDTTRAGQDYICDSASWRRTGWLDYVGECNAARLKYTTSYANNRYICLDTGWHRMSTLEMELGICYKENIGQFDTTKSSATYICDSTGWRTTVVDDYGGKCDSTIMNKIVAYGKSSYYCTGNAWKEMTSVEKTIGLCTIEKSRTCEPINGQYYCCYSTWISTNAQDARFGTCTSLREGEIQKVPDTAYVCENGKWYKGKIEDYAGPCSQNLGRHITYMGRVYGCIDTVQWITIADPLERELGYCVGCNDHLIKEYEGQFYECISSRGRSWWRTLFQLEPDSNHRKLYRCDSTVTPGTMESVHGTSFSQDYVCDYKTFGNAWKMLSTLDTVAGKYCCEEMLDSVVQYKNYKYMCDNSLTYYRWARLQ